MCIRDRAGEDYSPSIIANYTYDLVKEYNQFYHDFSILREENEAVDVYKRQSIRLLTSSLHYIVEVI